MKVTHVLMRHMLILILPFPSGVFVPGAERLPTPAKLRGNRHCELVTAEVGASPTASPASSLSWTPVLKGRERCAPPSLSNTAGLLPLLTCTEAAAGSDGSQGSGLSPPSPHTIPAVTCRAPGPLPSFGASHQPFRQLHRSPRLSLTPSKVSQKE